MPHHNKSPRPASQRAAPPRPAVEIRLGVVIRVARLRHPASWLLTLLAGMAGAAAGYWRLR